MSLLISLTFVVPFIVLQWVNRRAFDDNFPFVLFTVPSAGLPTSLFHWSVSDAGLVAASGRRRLRALKLGHWAGLVVSAVLISAYVNVVVDQLPCFLGVPNCD